MDAQKSVKNFKLFRETKKSKFPRGVPLDAKIVSTFLADVRKEKAIQKLHISGSHSFLLSQIILILGMPLKCIHLLLLCKFIGTSRS